MGIGTGVEYIFMGHVVAHFAEEINDHEYKSAIYFVGNRIVISVLLFLFSRLCCAANSDSVMMDNNNADILLNNYPIVK